MSTPVGPQLAFSDQLHATKYRNEGESFREAMNRVASALKDDDQSFHDFRDILMDMRFLPAGRVQAAMGAPRAVTPYNCFVSGTIADSFVDGEGSIMSRATEAAQTMRLGGGIGYGFSTLRPSGSLIKSLMSTSGGPLGFMRIFDALCGCVSSAGHRRGAQMGVMRIDHPDIEAFIRAKQNVTDFTNFNLSIGVTNEFMRCLATGEQFALQFEGKVHHYVDPRALWELVMRSTWDWAEPGVLFIDTINDMNNLWYCETIEATNPCAEQPLPPYGACLLGSFNLVKYITLDVASGQHVFDWAAFKRDIPIVVRAMDNIVDRAVYPLPQQRQEAISKRRMGLGVTGMANAIEAILGRASYGEGDYLVIQNAILQSLTLGCYEASVDLAIEKGPFPLFDAGFYGQSKFIQTLPRELQDRIRKHGIRNSHLTSIAPTGTISMTADNVSSAIEPVFTYSQERDIRAGVSDMTTVTLEDYGVRVFGVKGKRTQDVTVKEHLAVLANAQRWMDSAVSKTCNVPGSAMPWEDFKSVYTDAFYAGCKGVTTFNPDGKRMGILRSKDEPETTSVSYEIEDEGEGKACYISADGTRSCE